MILKINTNNIKIVEAVSFKERLQGLMGQKNIDYGMLFRNCNSIHTFFMKEEIDVLGLNEKNEIIFLETSVCKNKIITLHRPIKKTSILELPKFTCTSLHLKLGDVLFFEFEDIV